MLRKVMFGLLATASVALATLAPSAASAHGPRAHHHGWHGGWHGGYVGSSYRPTFSVGGLTDHCIQRRVVETRRGTRVRTVNVCAF